MFYKKIRVRYQDFLNIFAKPFDHVVSQKNTYRRRYRNSYVDIWNVVYVLTVTHGPNNLYIEIWFPYGPWPQKGCIEAQRPFVYHSYNQIIQE